MYYVWPKGDWRPVMQEMAHRIELFNGQRILAVAYDQPRDVSLVSAEFGGHFDIVLPCHNIKELRETVGWLPCLQRLVSDDPNSVIYTAHAKGVTHPDNPIIQRWTQEMTEITLDYWPAVEQALTRGAMCGAFRRTGKFPVVAHTCGDDSGVERWHYSGTFYWMRAKDLFARDWRKMDWTWYGTESYPGVQFSPEQCQCLVGDWCGDLYQPETWDQLQPEIIAWKTQQRSAAQSS